MADETPDIFDWVTVRSKCSVEHLFKMLMEVVDSDVRIFDERTRGHGGHVEFSRANRSKFVVSKFSFDAAGQQAVSSIVFEQKKSSIEVRRELDAPPFVVAKPSFLADQSCCLRVGDDNLALWQVSRLALEDFFFS